MIAIDGGADDSGALSSPTPPTSASPAPMISGIRRLKVSALRNLSAVALDELGRINVFHGANGSGKSSLLEALHLLLAGRSFRHHQTRPLIQDGVPACAVFGEHVDGSGNVHHTGVQKTRDGRTLAKRDGEALSSLAELADALPVVALHADSFELVTGGPAQRRQFLDWQLFHVEHGFMPVWRSAQRALSQRNSLIRHGKIDPAQLTTWTREYARHGEQIDRWRHAQVELLAEQMQPVLDALYGAEAPAIEIAYRRGWPEGVDLEQALSGDVERELRMGQTLFGPHRADLRLMANGRAAADVLSRGQTKLLVATLRLAQIRRLVASGRDCVLLVDDLGAELDRQHRHRFCRELAALGQQLFVTVIEPEELDPEWLRLEDARMFHVEHGTITAQAPAAAPQTPNG